MEELSAIKPTYCGNVFLVKLRIFCQKRTVTWFAKTDKIINSKLNRYLKNEIQFLKKFSYLKRQHYFISHQLHSFMAVKFSFFTFVKSYSFIKFVMYNRYIFEQLRHISVFQVIDFYTTRIGCNQIFQ